MFIRILRKFLLLMIFIFTLLNKTENRIVSLSIYRSNDNTIVINIIIIILGEGACWSLRGVGMGATEFGGGGVHTKPVLTKNSTYKTRSYKK